MERDIAVGRAAWEGSVTPRPVDIERNLRLRLASLNGDLDGYLAALGAVLSDDTGVHGVTAIAALINTLVADLEQLAVRIAGHEATESILREALLESFDVTVETDD